VAAKIGWLLAAQSHRLHLRVALHAQASITTHLRDGTGLLIDPLLPKEKAPKPLPVRGLLDSSRHHAAKCTESVGYLQELFFGRLLASLWLGWGMGNAVPQATSPI